MKRIVQSCGRHISWLAIAAGVALIPLGGILSATVVGVIIGGPLLLAIKWQATTYATEKADLIARWDANNTEHKKEIKELLIPAIEKMTTAIENDIESNGELGSDLRDLKTAMEIYFGPKQPGSL